MTKLRDPNTYGGYVAARRVAAGLSLRDVATALGVSHVYVGEVERGVRGPFAADKVERLIAAVPGITKDDLERHAVLQRGVQLHLGDAPPAYQNLGLALARRIENRDLPPENIQELLRLLGNDGNTDE